MHPNRLRASGNPDHLSIYPHYLPMECLSHNVMGPGTAFSSRRRSWHSGSDSVSSLACCPMVVPTRSCRLLTFLPNSDRPGDIDSKSFPSPSPCPSVAVSPLVHSVLCQLLALEDHPVPQQAQVLRPQLHVPIGHRRGCSGRFEARRLTN